MLLRSTLLSVAVATALSGAVHAQNLSPFSAFEGLSAEALATVKVKLTYLGPSDQMISSVIFATTPHLDDAWLFVPFHRTGYPYTADTLALAVFAASPSAIGSMIDSVAALPNVVDGDVDSDGYVSFSLLQSAGSPLAFESIVNQSNGQSLIARMSGALQGNAEGLRKLATFACETSLIPNDPPEDVTSRMSVAFGGFRRQRDSGEYSTKVRLTNTSGTPIPAPMTFMPGLLGANVEILNADGVTCAISPAGQFVAVPLEPSGLAPGEHVDVLLRFANPSNVRIRMRPLIFAGTGSR